MTLTNKSKITQPQTGIACQRDRGAFTPEEESHHRELLEKIKQSVQEVEELTDGYAFRFPSEADRILTLAEFITLERRCCSFFNFGLEVERGDGPLWLRLTGGEGTKQFLRAELGDSGP
jgi:hypothetical protein